MFKKKSSSSRSKPSQGRKKSSSSTRGDSSKRSGSRKEGSSTKSDSSKRGGSRTEGSASRGGSRSGGGRTGRPAGKGGFGKGRPRRNFRDRDSDGEKDSDSRGERGEDRRGGSRSGGFGKGRGGGRTGGFGKGGFGKGRPRRNFRDRDSDGEKDSDSRGERGEDRRGGSRSGGFGKGRGGGRTGGFGKGGFGKGRPRRNFRDRDSDGEKDSDSRGEGRRGRPPGRGGSSRGGPRRNFRDRDDQERDSDSRGEGRRGGPRRNFRDRDDQERDSDSRGEGRRGRPPGRGGSSRGDSRTGGSGKGRPRREDSKRGDGRRTFLKASSSSRRESGSSRGKKSDSRTQGEMLRTLVGIVKRHPDGFGFFIPEDASHPDVYLPSTEMQDLMSNDRIKVGVFASKRRKDEFSGQVLQLVERSITQTVGQFWPLSPGTGLIKDDSQQWGQDLKIKLKEGQKIKKGEWVQVRVLHWPGSHQDFLGEVQGSLGEFQGALEDNIRVIQQHSIAFSFPEEVLEEARKIPEKIPAEILKKRKDLRELTLVTIDGQTAQDFDDAIFVKSDTKGWTLYVAIADVSYYVEKNSALDKEAYQRGNSTYFPGFTLPMLPEKLSNNLCSLKPNEDRLAFVAEMHFDLKGKRQKASFYPAVICSKARLTYGEAQEIIEQNSSQSPEVITNILSAEKLARTLLDLRIKNHFINLEIPETEVSLNAKGEPVDITQSRRLFAHRLIEECMLAANQAVAEHLKENRQASLYRVHDLPKPDALKFLELFTQGLGRKSKLQEPGLHKKISELIEKFSQPPLSDIVQILILRSLSQAVYSPKNKGHFGLNLRYYTHFTSPIRRYSDLLVHRALKALLSHENPPYKEEELASIATNISASEQKSVKAERQVKDIKKARFLKKHLGEEMEGTISSCTRFGFFVKLRLYDIEGLVHINQLPGKWEFEAGLAELQAKSSGKRFKIGDLVLIQVVSSNIDTGQIDFDLKKHLIKKKFKTTEK